MNPELMQTIITTVVGAAITAVMGILTAYAVPWLRSKIALIKSEKARKALEMLLNFSMQTIDMAVRAAEQTLVKELKEKGEWNKETQAMVLNTVVEQVKASLSPEQIQEILAQTQLSIEEWIKMRIESSVH